MTVPQGISCLSSWQQLRCNSAAGVPPCIMNLQSFTQHIKAQQGTRTLSNVLKIQRRELTRSAQAQSRIPYADMMQVSMFGKSRWPLTLLKLRFSFVFDCVDVSIWDGIASICFGTAPVGKLQQLPAFLGTPEKFKPSIWSVRP